MADATYGPKIQKTNGGDSMVIASGGTVTADAGSTIDLSAATVDLPASAVVLSDIADGILTGAKLANVANANVIGGIPVVHRIDIADGVTADVDVVLTHKTRVIDAYLVKTGGAGGGSDTIQVKNGATAITNAMDINVADTTVVRAGTIDDAQHEIAAAGTLRITRTKASANNVACVVYVVGLRVA